MTKHQTALWAVALGLSLGPAVSNGLARFAYGLILPAMQDDLRWTYTQAGWLNTANAAGYLVGALMTFAFVDKAGPRRLFMFGILATPLAVAGSAVFPDLWLQSVFRLAAGIAGAAIFISGGALAAMLFREDPARNALAISLYFGGGGLGMIASGAVLPVVLDIYGPGEWPWAWLYLAGLSAVAVLPALAAACGSSEPSVAGSRVSVGLPLGAMSRVIFGYLLFAIGYIVYLTFFVALLRESSASAVFIAVCWTLLGLGVIAAPFLWRRILSQSAGGGALGLACLGSGIGTLLPLALTGSEPVMILSVSVFGLCFFMAPTAVTSFSRKNLDQQLWGRAVAMFTTVFAAGQIVGPTAAGMVADATGSVVAGMALAGILLLVGAAAAALQRPLKASST